MIELRPIGDGDLAWLVGESPAPPDAPRVCDGGIAPAQILALLRTVATSLREALRGDVCWLILAQGEAVGMISFTKTGQRPEIGYGVAPTREGSGYATAAVAALLPLARAAGYAGLTAETGTDNRTSQLVLERNGFTCTGSRIDPDDGALYTWTIGLNDD